MSDYPPEVYTLLEWFEANPYAPWEAIPETLRPFRAILKRDDLLFGGTMKTAPVLSDFGRIALIEYRRKPSAAASSGPAETTSPTSGNPLRKKDVDARMLGCYGIPKAGAKNATT